jgi:hypothetical protein
MKRILDTAVQTDTGMGPSTEYRVIKRRNTRSPERVTDKCMMTRNCLLVLNLRYTVSNSRIDYLLHHLFYISNLIYPLFLYFSLFTDPIQVSSFTK